MYGREDGPRRIAVEVFVLTFIAVAGLVFFNQSLGPVATGITAVILVASDILLLMAMLGVLPRLRERFRGWRADRRVNHDPLLVSDLRRLSQETKRVLYENGQGSLRYVAGLLAPELVGELLERARLYQDLVYLAETHVPWERIRLVTVVRAIVEHFGVSDSALERLYRVVSQAELDESAIDQWEVFRERYNQLRGAWERYAERMAAVTGLDATVPSRPARALNPRHILRVGG